MFKIILFIIISTTYSSIRASNYTFLGNTQNITCPGGFQVACYKGTQYCYDNSTILCQNVGHKKNITCLNNITTTCSSGTKDCYDYSPVYCPQILGTPKTIMCTNKQSYVIYDIECPAGSKDCYDDSPTYCKN